MHDRVTICGGVLGGHPRLVADAILAQSVANCRSTWRWRDGSSARMGPMKKSQVADGKVVRTGCGHACGGQDLQTHFFIRTHQ